MRRFSFLGQTHWSYNGERFDNLSKLIEAAKEVLKAVHTGTLPPAAAPPHANVATFTSPARVANYGVQVSPIVKPVAYWIVRLFLMVC